MEIHGEMKCKDYVDFPSLHHGSHPDSWHLQHFGGLSGKLNGSPAQCSLQMSYSRAISLKNPPLPLNSGHISHFFS